MFDNYYHYKMVSKKLIPSQEEEKAQQIKEDLDYQFQAHLRELRSFNNIESKINEQYETIKKAQLKANTPGINDKGVRRNLEGLSSEERCSKYLIIKKYVVNAYKVMMERGIKGCYIYAHNEGLKAFLRQVLNKNK